MSHKFLLLCCKLIFTVLVGLVAEVVCWGFFVLTHEQGRGKINKQYPSFERQVNLV